MTRALYLEDSYLKECTATIVRVMEGKRVVLDQTIFYPRGGGQPHDTGKIVRGNEVFKVVYVEKSGGEIIVRSIKWKIFLFFPHSSCF